MGNKLSHLLKWEGRRGADGKKRLEDLKRHPLAVGNTPPKTSASINIPPGTSASDLSSLRKSVTDNTPPRMSVDDSVFPTEDESLSNDPDMVSFDHGMKQRTEKVLSSLEQGMKSGVLELSSLKDVTSGLVEMDQHVVKFILECDELDVWANVEMRELVTEYFDHSLEALDFCGVLENCVQQARDNQMIIELAIRHMPDNGEPSVDECRQILQELDNFVRAENPFSTQFNELFSCVYGRQRQLQVKLSEKRKRFHRRERNVQLMRKITTAILTATCVSLVICAAVAMAVAAPVLGNSVSSSAALPFEVMHTWLRNLWSRYEQKIKAERGIIDATNWGTWVAIKDLDTINTEVRRLNGEVERIIRNIQFGQERGDSLAVQQAVRAIKRGQEQFIQQLEDLNEHANDCARRITRARAIVLERILGVPDRS